MAERKVLNKYYPPDFDPAKIPRRRMPTNQQIKVRMMLPMSIRCSTCGNYIYKGTKFNSRKEDVIGETYLGIQIFRFYFKCTKCSAEVTMKTDPQNSDYTVESGAVRNFEPWRAEDEVSEEEQRKRDAEEMGDAMKSLENRTLDSKREMDILSALDEMKSMKSRHAHVTVNMMLEHLQRSAPAQQDDKLEEDDEALIKSIFHGSKEVICRIKDDELDDEYDKILSGLNDGESSKFGSKKRKISHSPTDYLTKTDTDVKLKIKKDDPSGRIVLSSSTIKFSVVRKSPVKKSPEAETQTKEENNINLTSTGLQSICQHYDSSEEEEYLH